MISMDIKVTKENGALYFKISGRIDTQSSPDLQTAFENAFDTKDAINKIVLDFAQVEYLSSSGLRVLLGLHKKLAQTPENETLTLINVNNDVYDVLDMTGFTEILEINPQNEE